MLTHYLPLYFPEADRFHRNLRGDWFFAFLEHYPSPRLISAIDRDAFIAEAWDVVGRKVAKERLLIDIYETAKTPVGLPVSPNSDAVGMFRLVLGEGRGLIAQRNQIERRAVELLKDLPDYQLLTFVPGIGPINALSILAEAGDLRRFNHHRQFLKFCGIDFATIEINLYLIEQMHINSATRQPSPHLNIRTKPCRPIPQMYSNASLNAHTLGKVIPEVSLLKLWRKLARSISQHSLVIMQIAIPRQTININHAPAIGCYGEVLRLPCDRLIL